MASAAQSLAYPSSVEAAAGRVQGRLDQRRAAVLAERHGPVARSRAPLRTRAADSMSRIAASLSNTDRCIAASALATRSSGSSEDRRRTGPPRRGPRHRPRLRPGGRRCSGSSGTRSRARRAPPRPPLRGSACPPCLHQARPPRRSGPCGCLCAGSAPRRASSASGTSGLRQLAHDGGQVDPDVLAADMAVLGELDHVQQAELERPSAALQAEGAARRPAAPDRFVDQEALAVEPRRGSRPGPPTDRRTAPRRTAARTSRPSGGPRRPADDVVLARRARASRARRRRRPVPRSRNARRSSVHLRAGQRHGIAPGWLLDERILMR